MTMPIDNEIQDSEAMIAQIINSKEYVLPSNNAENYKSKEFVRELSDREKAILTIIAQITSESQKLGFTIYDIMQREEYEDGIELFHEMLIDGLEKDGILGNERHSIICSDGNIYYISREDYENDCLSYQDSEAMIAQIINSKEYVLPSYNAENYISKEFVRKLSDREKAIFTIRAQSTSELHKLGMSRNDVLRRIDLIKCIGFFQGMLIDGFEKDGILGNERNFIICSDEKIYYISREEAMDTCKHCPRYKKCDKRLS